MAKSKRVLKHVHKLKRIKYTNGEAVYFCVSGECEYEVNVKKAFGKPNECWRCGVTFPLSELSIRLAKPHCSDCTHGKKDDNVSDKIGIKIPALIRVTAADELRARLAQSIGELVGSHLPEDDSDLL